MAAAALSCSRALVCQIISALVAQNAAVTLDPPIIKLHRQQLTQAPDSAQGSNRSYQLGVARR